MLLSIFHVLNDHLYVFHSNSLPTFKLSYLSSLLNCNFHQYSVIQIPCKIYDLKIFSAILWVVVSFS